MKVREWPFSSTARWIALASALVSVPTAMARNVPIVTDDAIIIIQRPSASGTITSASGLPTGTTVNSDDGSSTVVDPSGSFIIDFLGNGAFQLTPRSPLQTCTFSPSPVSLSVPPDGVANFTATCPLFLIGGIVSGNVIPPGLGININGATVPLAANNTYGRSGLLEGTYLVAPALPAGSECVSTPPSVQLTLTQQAASTNFSLSCPTYIFSGAVTGTYPPGITVSLNGASQAISGGRYSSTLLAGSYTAIPQIAAQYGCTVTPNSITHSLGPSFTSGDFNISCPTYVVGGSITASPALPSGMTVAIGGTPVPVQAGGTFSLPGVFAGSYTVAPTRSGCTFTPPSRTATVGPDSVANNFSASCTAVISGSAGEPGVTITAGGKTATSLLNNSYSLTGLTPGSYVVTPSKTGCTFTPATRSISVANDDIAGIDFAASCTYSLSGNVGAVGVSVSLSPASAPAATSDSTGNYTFSALPRGTYTVTPSRQSCSFTPSSRQATLGPNSVTADFIASCVHSISGNAGIVGATISAGGRTATSASDGSYLLASVQEGQVTLTAARSGCTFVPQNQSINLTADITQNFAPNCGSGSFTLTGNAVVSGALIQAVSGSNTYVAITDPQGNFQFPRLPQGNFVLTASKSSCSSSPAQKSFTMNAARTENFALFCPPKSFTPAPAPTLATDILKSTTQLKTTDGSYVYVYEVDVTKIRNVPLLATDPYWWQYYRAFFSTNNGFVGGGSGPDMNSGGTWNAGPSIIIWDSDWTNYRWDTISALGYRTVDSFGNADSRYYTDTYFDSRDAFPVRPNGNLTAVHLLHHFRGTIGTDWFPANTSLGFGYVNKNDVNKVPVTLNFQVQLYKSTTFEAGYTGWQYLMPGEVRADGWALIPLDPWVLKNGRGVQWIVIKPTSEPMPKVRVSSSQPSTTCPLPGRVGEGAPIQGQTPCVIDPKLWLPQSQVVVQDGVCKTTSGDPFPGLSDEVCGLFANNTYTIDQLLFQLASMSIAFGGDSKPDYASAGRVFLVTGNTGGGTGITELTVEEAKEALRANGKVFMNGSLNSLAAAQENATVLANAYGPVVLIYMAQNFVYPTSQSGSQVTEIDVLRQLLDATSDMPIRAYGHSWSGHIILQEAGDRQNVTKVVINPAQLPWSTVSANFADDIGTAVGKVCLVVGFADPISQLGGGQYNPDDCFWSDACRLQNRVGGNSSVVTQYRIGDATNRVGHGLVDVLTHGGQDSATCN